nr:MAG TPA: hypothetical protein [Caudoviricetes sp.]
MDEMFSNNSFIQQTIKQQFSDEQVQEIEELGFNPLKMYFGEDCVINEKITIHQPSIQDFIDSNSESDIYGVITPFVSNTTAYRLQLWDMGIDWNKISNLELFSILIKSIDFNYSKLIFGDIDFSTFNLYQKQIDKDPVLTLYSQELDLEIDEDTRNKMCKYIQFMFNSFPPEEEFTSNKILKQDLINKDRQKLVQKKKEASENKNQQSLLSMIAFYLNHPGCHYKKNELREVGYFEFMYNIQRLQIYESTRALFGGLYSGMCDLSKVDKNEFNFMRDVKITA